MAHRGRSGTGGAILALVLLLPVAGAAEADPALTVASPIAAPADSQAELEPFALYLGNASSVGRFDLTMPAASVVVSTKTFQKVLTPLGPLAVENPLSFRQSTWTVEGARLRFVGDAGPQEQTRFVGVYPDVGTVEVTAAEDFSVVSPPESAIGNNETTDGTDPAAINYYVRESRPHLYAKLEGTARYVGVGALKIRGLTVEIATDHNVTKIETGSRQTGPTESTTTILYLRFDEPATFEVETGRTVLEIAAAQADLEGSGSLSFRAIAGELRTREGIYQVPGTPGDHPAVIHGRFRAALTPLATRDSIRLVMDGDFQAEGLVFKAAPAPSQESPAGWIGLAILALAAVVVGGGGSVVLVRRRRRAARAPVPEQSPPDPFAPLLPGEIMDAEYCVKAAVRWMSMGEYEKALQWLGYARRLSPTSARILAETGFCLGELGKTAAALDAYLEAHQLATDHEPAIGAAYMLSGQGAPAEQIQLWLERAVERSPWALFSVEEEFPSVTDRAEWEPVQRRTLDRLERGFRGGRDD